jgi:hypothetical protein
MDRNYLTSLHSEVREELVRVDTKIGVLLRAFLITASVVVAGAVAGKWNPAVELKAPGEFIWWTGVASVLMGVSLLIWTLNPITTHSEVHQGPPRYWGDVRKYSNRAELRKALGATSDASNVDRLVDQIFELSTLAGRKYAAIHWSSGLYMLGLVVAGLAVALS